MDCYHETVVISFWTGTQLSAFDVMVGDWVPLLLDVWVRLLWRELCGYQYLDNSEMRRNKTLQLKECTYHCAKCFNVEGFWRQKYKGKQSKGKKKICPRAKWPTMLTLLAKRVDYATPPRETQQPNG